MTDSETMEKEANLFAMYLLMPENLVRAEVKKLGGFDIEGGEGIISLAKKFKVSVPLMTLRLGQIFGVKIV